MAYDDLISKLRSQINNGFSIGMSGKDRLALADFANMEAKLNPADAENILGGAADDIGFGTRGGNKYSLAAINKLGNDVSFPGLAGENKRLAYGGGQYPDLSPLQFRAKGGPVLPGQPYIVGEKGPELMVPETPGYIQPNSSLAELVDNPQIKPFTNVTNGMVSDTARRMLDQAKGSNFVNRLDNYNSADLPMIKNPDGSFSTHRMASTDNMVFPTIVQEPGKQDLTQFTNWRDAARYARQTGEYIPTSNPQDAEWLGNNYKKAFPQGYFDQPPANRTGVQQVENPQNIVAYTQGSTGFNPIRSTGNGVTNFDKTPMTLAQVNALDTGWNANPANQGPQQDVNAIPISVGARQGNMTNLADLTRGAMDDRAMKSNAMFGLNPQTMTPQDPSQGNIQSLANLRSSLDRSDVLANNAALQAEWRQQTSEDRLRGQLEAARIRGDAAVQAATIRALNKVANGGDNPLAQSSFVDPETGRPLVYDKRTGTYKIATVESGSVAPKPGAVTPENAAKAQLIEQARSYMPQIKGLYLTGDGKVNRENVWNSTTRTPLTQGRQASTLILDAMEAKLRAESGAAVPEPEVKRMAKRYMPSPLDDDKTIQMKLNNLESYLSGAVTKMNRGKGTGGQSAAPKTASGYLSKFGGK